MSVKYNAVEMAKHVYVFTSLWGLDDFERLPDDQKSDYRTLVETRRVNWAMDHAKAAMLRAGVDVPDSWLAENAAAVDAGRALSDDHRHRLFGIVQEMQSLLWRLAVEGEPGGEHLAIMQRLGWGSEPSTPSGMGMVGAKELAAKHGVNYRKLRGRLETYRKGHDDACVEVENSKPNRPKILYDEAAVMHIIQDLKTGSGSAAK